MRTDFYGLLGSALGPSGYVGQTTDTRQRFAHHRSEQRIPVQPGFKMELFVLDWTAGAGAASALETAWIQESKALGASLLNKPAGRIRADADKYTEPLASVHIQLSPSLQQTIRMTAAAGKKSLAVLRRDALEQGWEQVAATEKKNQEKKGR